MRAVIEASAGAAKHRYILYQRKLKHTLNILEKELQSGTTSKETTVYNDLHTIVTASSEQVVGSAEAFFHSASYQNLVQLAATKQGVYKDLRHLVGRLCLWYNAASFVVRHATEFRQVLAGADVQVISQRDFEKKPIAIASTVQGVFAKVFRSQGPIAPMAGQRLAYCQPLLDALHTKPQRPIIHAEAAMAHYFSEKGLTFAYNDPYISCSKPSCYACMLYMRALPLDLVDRPYHGNAWLRWKMPVSRSDNERRDARILRDMFDFVRRDVESCVMGERYGRRAVFESTTGMSGQLPEV